MVGRFVGGVLCCGRFMVGRFSVGRFLVGRFLRGAFSVQNAYFYYQVCQWG